MMYLKYVLHIPFVSSCAASYLVRWVTLYPKKVADTPAMRFRRCYPGALEALAKGSGPTRFFWPSGVGVGCKWGWEVGGRSLWKGLKSPKFHVQHQKATGTGWLLKFISQTSISQFFSSGSDWKLSIQLTLQKVSVRTLISLPLLPVHC